MNSLLVALASFQLPLLLVVCQERENIFDTVNSFSARRRSKKMVKLRLVKVSAMPYNFPTINNDELTMVPWKDHRSFDWLQDTCNFSEPCGFGSWEAKWIKLNGSLDSLYPTLSAYYVPDFPAIGFGTNTYNVAHLYSDPLPCLVPTNATISYKLWFSGITSVEGCILSISDGSIKCGVKISNFKTSFHYIHAKQPLPIHDPQRGPYVFVFKFIVPSGFVIIDDISINGERCEFSKKNPSDMVDVVQLLRYKDVRDEISAVLSKDLVNLQKFMQTWYLQNKHQFNLGEPGHVCAVVPCNFDCDWSRYSVGSGLKQFDKITDLVQNEIGMWRQTVQSVKFRSNEVAYAILTSPLILPDNSGRRYALSVKFSKATIDKNVFVCYFKKEIKESSCLKLVLEQSTTNADWYRAKSDIPDGTEQFQILISQTEKSDPQLELSMIRDMNVLGC